MATKLTGGMTGVVESNGSNKTDSDRAPTPDNHHLQIQEEEIIASGWGGDGDEDGMGML
jgi:RNA-binding protein 26